MNEIFQSRLHKVPCFFVGLVTDKPIFTTKGRLQCLLTL
jgi:hypothetical protein